MLFGRTTANRISRFVEEIPEDDIVKKGVTRGYGYSEPTSQQREYQQYVERQPRRTHTVSAPPRPAAPKTAEKPAFALGDHVKHRAFGSGVITKVTPMGGDALLEIEFESAGRKRLMLRAAGQFMVKE